MRFGTWNVRSLYRAGSLTAAAAAAKELARYELELVSVREVSWDTGGKVKLGDYIVYEKEKKIINWEQDFLCTTELEFVRGRISYIVVRDYGCNIIVLNVHAPSEEKSDDSKDSIYEELGQIFYHFYTYHMEILLGDFNAKMGETVFSIRQLGMGVYIRIIIIMVLEQ
jgi:hypothetical protein